jgi:hypothetical protein
MIEYTVKVDDKNGNRFWRLNGKRHREDGPALEMADGVRSWWINGERHRLDGPALEMADGSRSWYFNGKLHRLDGPAIEWTNGELNRKFHRLDGPAVEWADRSWWVDGKQLTEAEFNSRQQRCAGKVVEIDGKKYKLMEV